MLILSRRVRYAAIATLCAAIAAACDSSSPIEVDSITGLAGKGNGAGATAGALEISPSQVSFGSTSTSASLTLENSSPKTISWTATESAGWLSMGTKSGSLSRWGTSRVPLTATRSNLAPGTYTTKVTFVSSGLSVIVPVSVTVPSPLTVSPTQINFGTTGTSATITLTNNASTSLTWTASESAGWLSLSLLSGTIAAKTSKAITLLATRAGKTAGTYTTNVSIAAGAAGSVSVPVSMSVPSTSTSTSVLLAGQLVDQFGGQGLSGLTVQYGGKSAITDGSGRFTISGSPTSTLSTLTLSGSGIYKRITYAKTGNTLWRVVPTSFSMSAFNDVARDEFGPSTVRWVARPTVYIDSRPEGFSSSELSTWINEVKSQVPTFISKWTGGTMTPASVIVTSNPPSDFTSGTIVIHISDNSSDYGGSSTMIGYARLFYTSSGAVSGSAIWLRYPRYPGTSGASKRKGILGHELGHGIGLGHMEGSTPSLMYASIGSKTDLLDFDLKSASFHYGRSPHNGSPDTDNQSSFLGMLVPSAAPVAREWLCEGGEE